MPFRLDLEDGPGLAGAAPGPPGHPALPYGGRRQRHLHHHRRPLPPPRRADQGLPGEAGKLPFIACIKKSCVNDMQLSVDEVTKSDVFTAGHVVAGLARVPELRRGADGVRRPLRRRLLEHQQGTRIRLLPAALRKRHAGKLRGL